MFADTFKLNPSSAGTKTNDCSHAPCLSHRQAKIIRRGHSGAPHAAVCDEEEEEEEAGEVFPVASCSRVAGPLMMMWAHQQWLALVA